MFKTIIVILVSIAAVVGISYAAHQYYEYYTFLNEIEEVEVEQGVADILENLKQGTDIEFSALQSVEIKWVVKRGKDMTDVIIQGQGFEVKEVADEKLNAIKEFLEGNGFELDIYNVASGTIGGLEGFRKGRIVVSVGYILSNFDPESKEAPTQFDKIDIVVKCGKSDIPIVSFDSAEEAVKKLFAEKYQTKSSAIALDISQETVNHIKGTIKVLDEFAQGGAGDKGAFAAGRADNGWQIMEDSVKYNFSDDINIESKENDKFFIVLNSNPTTGFQWEVDFNSDYLQMTDRQFSAPQEPIPGAGGDEVFSFLALKQGSAKITFSYLRPWEKDKPAIEEKVYSVTIKSNDWQTYQNEEHGYSFDYPADCLYGPLPGYCKLSPPEERSDECLCYLNATDVNSVSLGTYTGEKENLTGASFVVFHSIYVDRYSPPADTDLIEWLKENFFYSHQDIPDEINTEIDGIPAVRIYTPFSGMAYSQEDIYFVKDGKLFKINMLDVDDENNRKLYDQILASFEN